jgi:hypothetical protein
MELAFYTEQLVKAGRELRRDGGDPYTALVRCTVVNQGRDAITIRHRSCSWETSYSTPTPHVHFTGGDCISDHLIRCTLKPGESYERDLPLLLLSPSRRRPLDAGETRTLQLWFDTYQGTPLLESKPLTIRVSEVAPLLEKAPLAVTLRPSGMSADELTGEVKNISKEPLVVGEGYWETWMSHHTKVWLRPTPDYSQQRGDRLLLPGQSYRCPLRLTFVEAQPGEKITTRVRMVTRHGKVIQVDSEPISLTVPQ